LIQHDITASQLITGCSEGEQTSYLFREQILEQAWIEYSNEDNGFCCHWSWLHPPIPLPSANSSI